MDVQIKHCGIREAAHLAASVRAGTQFIGFMHYAPSRRYITVEAAAQLCADTSLTFRSVGVCVNPDAALITSLSGAYPDIIQLHGSETPAEVSHIRQRTGKPIIKAIGVADADDILIAHAYEEVTDYLLFDTKHAQHGGTGTAFNWHLLRGFTCALPWFLSGGLRVDNICEAIAITGAEMVDVSSGIEKQSGVKDPQMIHAFNEMIMKGCHDGTTHSL